MNNFMVILTDYDSIFLSVNTDKHNVEDIVTRYFTLKKFKLINQSIIDFFDNFGYSAVNTIETGTKLEDIIISKNYQVIDMSNIDEEIIKALS